ncbi:MAG: hypothetical protein LC808_04565 [Actinobacteria bacterium]|nr:hypothetical protein [Actinomycetota bacterium]
MGGQDVQPDQVVVPLAGCLLELGDVEPLRDGLPNRDVALRVLVFVDLALQLGQRLLRGGVALGGQRGFPVSGSVPE